MFSTVGTAAFGLSSVEPLTYCSTFHSESTSAGRFRLRTKNCAHADGHNHHTGRLTTSQASTAASRHRPKSGIRLPRRHSTSSGMRNSAG